MGFTSAAAAVFLEAYIERFGPMEVELHSRSAIAMPQTFDELLRLAAEKAEENERLSGQVRQQTKQIAFQAPKVEAYEGRSEADGSICVTEAAKNLQVRSTDLFKCLRTRAWIYRRAGTRGDLYDQLASRLASLSTRSRSRIAATATRASAFGGVLHADDRGVRTALHLSGRLPLYEQQINASAFLILETKNPYGIA